jgi:hypothetical protein
MREGIEGGREGERKQKERDLSRREGDEEREVYMSLLRGLSVFACSVS